MDSGIRQKSLTVDLQKVKNPPKKHKNTQNYPKDYEVKRKKIDSSYEYYIHYTNHNRRMDEWLPRCRVQIVSFILL